MKPRRLIIEGFNSFAEKQEIDFSKLTDRGLFGIFGPTGSGKSSILDAVIFSLYGKVPRGGNEYINSSAKAAHISYEFEIGEGSNRRIFVSDKSVRKNKDGTYRYSFARLYEKKDGEEIIIAESVSNVTAEIVKILGLTETDFMRSVVLPQGKFSEFLMLTGEARRNMLERIFGLERFGQKLMERIKKIKIGFDQELNLISGELMGFQGISEETLKSEKEALKELEREEEDLKKGKQLLDKEYERCRSLWELQKELEVFLLQQEELDKSSVLYESKKIILKSGIAAANVKPIMDDAEDTQGKINKSIKNLEYIDKTLTEASKKLDEVQAEYNKAFELKEKNIPGLIKKEADYNSAVNIQKTNIKLMEEREELLKKYRKEEADLGRLRFSLKEAEDKRDSLSEKVNIREKIILEKSVDLSYKDRVQYASKKEEEFTLLKENKDSLENKIRLRNISIEDEKVRYEELKKHIHIILNKIKNLNDQLSGLSNESFEDSSILLSKQDRLNKAKERYKELKINSEKLREVDSRLSEIRKNKAALEKNIESIRMSLEEKNNLLEILSHDIEKLNIKSRAAYLAKDLKEGEPCPVCGSIHHPVPVTDEDYNVNEKEAERHKLENEISELNKALNELGIKYAGIEKEEEHINSSLEEIKDIIAGDSVSEAEEISKRLEEEFNRYVEDTKAWKEKKAELTDELNKLLEGKSVNDKAEAKLEEGINKENEILEGLVKDQNENLKKYNEVIEEYKLLKEELNLDNISDELKRIRENEIVIGRYIKENSSMRKNIDELNDERERLSQALSTVEKTLSEISVSGKEKALVIKTNNDEIRSLCENTEPEEFIKAVRAKIYEINKTEEKYRMELDTVSKNLQQLMQEKASETKNKDTLSDILQEINKKLLLALKENNFDSVYEVTASFRNKAELESLSREIDEFNRQCENVKNNIQRLKLKTKGEKVDDEYFEELKSKREITEQSLKNVNGDIAVKSENIISIARQLEQCEALIKKKEKVEHKISLLTEILNLTKGNAFVEYIARNQLNYIAEEASARLKNITNGRYALLLDDDFRFNIRDDFNGGYVRPVNTMSGGEIFLTSLSLALALSSQIQLKGNVPLEFFFLDEGFGTLDSELLDTVMSSLEKLHSDKLSVGIISHVDEIKNRVPVKLIVEPAVSGITGTKVRVDYT